MSGFEALGMACVIFQTINFAHETTRFCMDVYRGQKSPDSTLEENAIAMKQAAGQVKASCCTAATPEEQCLIDVAEKCITAASRISDEVQKITRLHKKGDLIAAVRSGLRSWRKRSQMNDLDNSLRRYTDTMQTLLISRVWTVDSVTAYVAKQEQDQETRHAIFKKRQRFLNSFRFDEINQRKSDITDPEDAIFNRIFQSFENTAESKETTVPTTSDTRLEEIDTVWHSFTDWLKSDEYLFWIQGKPGSGKSTLVKFITSQDATQTLLDQGNPNTKILSHFFWKLGTSLQNGIKGFYCSILYQLVDDTEGLADSIVDEVPAAASKESYHDWSVRELERLLLVALNLAKGQQPLCIFIDGLDEFVDYDGGEDLVQKVLNLKQFERVKICVASRAEPLLREQLNTVPNLRLHDLTAPEMRQWVQEKLINLQKEGKLQSELSLRLTNMLLEKAEGVFLWIRVAPQSVIRGLKNKDSEKVLVSRLEQLPEKLEDLCYDMWKRLGEDESIYRTSAATYLRFVIVHQSLSRRLQYFSPTLNILNTTRLACASRPDFLRELLTIDKDIDYERLRVMSETIESEIRTQCAGLLELRSMDVGAVYSPEMFEAPTFAMEVNRIVFIHRTAHDFLIDTESGQKILSSSKIPNIDMEFLLTGGYLCFLRLLSNKFNGPFLVRIALKGLTPLSVHQGSDEGMNRVKDLLSIVECFYNAEVLHSGLPQWPQPSFLAAIADFWAIFEWAIQDVDTDSATACIQSIPWYDLFQTSKNDFWPSLRILVLKGADPCAITSYLVFITSKIHYGMRTTALWNLLYASLMGSPADWINDWLGMASAKESISVMLEKGTGVEYYSFLSPRYTTQDHGYPLREVVYEELPLSISRGFVYPILLVNMSYLFEMLMNFSSPYDLTALNHHPRLIRPELHSSESVLRFIAVETSDNGMRWFRVIDQEPFEDLVNIMRVRIREGHELSHFPEWYERVSLLIDNKNVLQEVEEVDVLETSVSGKRLGKCASEETGLLNCQEQ